MTPNEYQELAHRTAGSLPTGGVSNAELTLVWGSLALCGEAGELAEHIKKGVFHQKGINKDIVAKELGDVLWYAADVATNMGLSLSDIMQQNIEKLKARYPQGFDVKLAPKKERYITVIDMREPHVGPTYYAVMDLSTQQYYSDFATPVRETAESYAADLNRL